MKTEGMVVERLEEFFAEAERTIVSDCDFTCSYDEVFISEKHTLELSNAYICDSKLSRYAIKLKDCFINKLTVADVEYGDADEINENEDGNTLSQIINSSIYNSTFSYNHISTAVNETLRIIDSEVVESEFQNVIFRNCVITSCNLSNCTLVNCHVVQCTIDNCGTVYSIISQSMFTRTSMYDSDMNDVVYCSLIACDISYANITNSRSSLSSSYMSKWKDCEWESGEIFDTEVEDYVTSNVSPEFYMNSDQNNEEGLI